MELVNFNQWAGPVLVVVGMVGIVVSLLGLTGFFRRSENRD